MILVRLEFESDYPKMILVRFEFKSDYPKMILVQVEFKSDYQKIILVRVEFESDYPKKYLVRPEFRSDYNRIMKSRNAVRKVSDIDVAVIVPNKLIRSKSSLNVNFRKLLVNYFVNYL